MTLEDKIFGDVVVTFKDHAAGTEVIASMIPGTFTINQESPEDNAQFEDGSGADQEIGRRTILEFDVSDVVPADFDTIESYQGDVDILVVKTNKTYTFQGSALQPNYNITSIVDSKMHIKTTGNWPVNTAVATTLGVA